MSAAIEVKDLSHVYGGTVPALEDISLQVPAGRFTLRLYAEDRGASRAPTGP